MIAQINTSSNDLSRAATTNPKHLVNDLNEIGQKIISHIWYKLLNASAVGGLFTTAELSERGGCSGRTVYSFLKERAAKGFLTVVNKGRNGLLITVLEKGWRLTLSYLKTAFLAYFRDKRLIPFINTPNTPPPDGGSLKPKDRIEKMCQREGLTEPQTRAVKEKVSMVDKVKSLGGLVKHFVNQVKEGILKPVFTSEEIAKRTTRLAMLKQKADLDTKRAMQIEGKYEPKPKSVIMDLQEMDAFNVYHAELSYRTMKLFNQLCIESGLSKVDKPSESGDR